MIELPLEPHVEQYQYDICPNCKDWFISDDALNKIKPSNATAWFDEDRPCCSDWCCEEYTKEFGWEHEQERRVNAKNI